eukprot:scaffold1192_cov49-Prasinocladus_malaysianus.AAC.3
MMFLRRSILYVSASQPQAPRASDLRPQDNADCVCPCLCLVLEPAGGGREPGSGPGGDSAAQGPGGAGQRKLGGAAELPPRQVFLAQA